MRNQLLIEYYHVWLFLVWRFHPLICIHHFSNNKYQMMWSPYSLAPTDFMITQKVFIQVSADGGEPKKLYPLHFLTDCMVALISFTSAIWCIDEESLLDKDPIIVPSHECPKFVEIKSHTGLPHWQPSVIPAVLACASLDDKDMDSCITFEKEITVVTFADHDVEFTNENDGILFQDDLCIPFGMQLLLMTSLTILPIQTPTPWHYYLWF